jgi:hypothetical protein
MQARSFRIAGLVTLVFFATCFVHVNGPWAASGGEGRHGTAVAASADGEGSDAHHGTDGDCGWVSATGTARTATAKAAAPAESYLILALAPGSITPHAFPAQSKVSAIRAAPLQSLHLKSVILRI